MGSQQTIWAHAALDLAGYTFSSLVNRTDAFGQCFENSWVTLQKPFTVPVIEGHYRGDSIIGVHPVSLDNCCRFMVFDVDSHGDDPSAAHEMADRVRAFLEGSEIPYLEEDSDGRGGRHFWVRFAEKQNAAVVCRIIQQIKSKSGIDCEVFPKGERTEQSPHGGSLIRLPGKHPAHDHWSRFLIDGRVLTDQEAMQAWLTLPCVETRVLARIGEENGQKRTEENRGTQRITEEDRSTQRSTEENRPDLCNPLSSSVHERIEEAILKSQPLEERQRNKSLFKFSRMLAGIPECRGWPLSQWKLYVKKWHQRALPVIGTKPFEDTWSDFTRSHEKVKIPYDRDFMVEIFESIPPETIDEYGLDYESPVTRSLLRLCLGLDRHEGGGVFFLACRTAGEVCGFCHMTAANHLHMLVVDDVLRLMVPGTPSGNATRYQLNPKFSTCDRSKQ